MTKTKLYYILIQESESKQQLLLEIIQDIKEYCTILLWGFNASWLHLKQRLKNE